MSENYDYKTFWVVHRYPQHPEDRLPRAVHFHLWWNALWGFDLHWLVTENRTISVPVWDQKSRGWLFVCSCGKVWAY